METKKISLIAMTAIALLAFAPGCASARKVKQAEGPGATQVVPGAPATPMGPPEPFGPLPPIDPGYGPQPIKLKPAILVLGPGFARGFAHVGVLQALDAEKIPIGGIVGTEMGGFVGALFAVSGSINSFEWSLLQFKEETLIGKRGIIQALTKRTYDGSALDKALRAEFGKTDINQTRIPLRLGISRPQANDAEYIQSGQLASALRASLAVEGFMTPVGFSGQDMQSAATNFAYAVSEARRLGDGPVIVVDLSTAAPASQDARELSARSKLAAGDHRSQKELREADLVIRPSLADIQYLDYQKRTDITFRGKSAAQAVMAEIKRLVGSENSGGTSP